MASVIGRAKHFVLGSHGLISEAKYRNRLNRMRCMLMQTLDDVKAKVAPWRQAAVVGKGEGDRFFRSIRSMAVSIKSISSVR